MNESALVSIVIPTYRRLPDLRLAVASALTQTYRNIEVIVVSDGPDAEVRAALEGTHPLLRYVELAVNSGPAEARNEGVRASRGEWLTFLDDDDTMLPEKVEHQLRLTDRNAPKKMISCRTIYRHDGQDDVWPRRPLASGEDVGDYILLRPSLLGRPGVLPIQSLLIHRSVIEQVPFTTHSDHEDWAWLLDVWHRIGARIEFVWEPLVVYNIVTDSISRSRRMNWRDSLAWAEQYRPWLSHRAYTSFLATKVALKAKRAGDWKGLREIAGLVGKNKPGMLDLMFLAGIFLLPGFVLHAAWKRSLSAGGSKPGVTDGTGREAHSASGTAGAA
ncbi:MAG TPA: glycosyltransferase family 2 protein [Acidobacteriaceae bacterium]|jgi:glycosyltransferase involved in cell wall biosynthesis